jgi:hypothetical protein
VLRRAAAAQVFTGRIDVAVQDGTGAVLPAGPSRWPAPMNQSGATDAGGRRIRAHRGVHGHHGRRAPEHPDLTRSRVVLQTVPGVVVDRVAFPFGDGGFIVDVDVSNLFDSATVLVRQYDEQAATRASTGFSRS